MRLKTLEVLKDKIKERNNKGALHSKQLESRLTLELKEKLTRYLEEADSVALEVNPKVLGEFLNILSDNFLTVYNFEQIDKNKFVFSHREITL